jgi:hypothetical protein
MSEARPHELSGSADVVVVDEAERFELGRRQACKTGSGRKIQSPSFDGPSGRARRTLAVAVPAVATLARLRPVERIARPDALPKDALLETVFEVSGLDHRESKNEDRRRPHMEGLVLLGVLCRVKRRDSRLHGVHVVGLDGPLAATRFGGTPSWRETPALRTYRRR